MMKNMPRMNRILISIVLLASNAMADNYDCDMEHTLTREEVQQKLNGEGYKTISGMLLDDCMYQVRVYDKSKARWHIHINPKTGRIIGKARIYFMG